MMSKYYKELIKRIINQKIMIKLMINKNEQKDQKK